MTHQRTAGILLIFEALLLFIPLFVLGAAIEWPASLDEPAHVMLPRIQEETDLVTFGYFVYLIYSILVIPVALYVQRVISDRQHPILWTAAGFAVASGVLRTLGIIRWLSVMPELADQYVDASSNDQATLAIVYDSFNAYAGTVGEVLGVQLFMALWILLIAVYILTQPTHLPRWIGVSGIFTGLVLMVGLLELFGVDVGAFISVIVSVLHFWMLGFGVYLLRNQNVAERTKPTRLAVSDVS